MSGAATGDWALVDAGDIIVHVFRPEVRDYYDLEGMWSVDEPAKEKVKRRACGGPLDTPCGFSFSRWAIARHIRRRADGRFRGPRARASANGSVSVP